MEKKIKEILSSILEISISEINEEISKKTVAQWDSLKHIMLVVELENKFNIKFELKTIPKINSYIEIVKQIDFLTNKKK